MVMKILPRDSSGGFVTQYCYDKADRIAYMKDPALGNRYRFYLYDKLGRLCVQGTCSGGNQNNTILSTTTYTGGSGGLCKTGYDAPKIMGSVLLIIFQDRQSTNGNANETSNESL